MRFGMAGKKRKKTSKNKHSKGFKYLTSFLLVVFFLGGTCLLYVGFLAAKVIIRCQGTRWELPSKVYSAPVPLYPGLNLNASGLYEYLKDLGYRRVKGIPKMPGSFSKTRSLLSLYQRSFDYPSVHIDARLVKIYLKNGVVVKIVDGSAKSALSLIQIEPMEIAALFGKKREERYLVDLDQVPKHLIDATLAIEDRRFYEHGALDFRGILRAFSKNLLAKGIKEGGSTLTQQLVKNMFLTPERSLWRKFNEAIMAMILERYYTKDEILEMYYNEVYLGQKGSVEVHGVGEAARFYFGRSVERLDLDQCALLAGLIKAPNSYSPYRDHQAALLRRNLVLKTLYKLNKISRSQYEETVRTPVEAIGYFYGKAQAPYFVDYAIAQIKDLYPREVLGAIGLSIFTSLDIHIQRWAREALQKGLDRLEAGHPSLSKEGGLQAAVVVIEPSTGRILAMVGGRDYVTSQFNRVTQAVRQPGSLLKPLVYTEALIEGYCESSMLEDKPVHVTLKDGTVWSPANFNNEYLGNVPLIKALAFSLNGATVRLARELGFEKIYDLAFKVGFPKERFRVPSMILGGCELSPLEITRLYSIFASHGFSCNILSIRNVLDREGNRLQMKRIRIKEVLDPSVCEVMENILRCATMYGTGRGLSSYGLAGAAGKTGTSNEERDAWFAGYLNGYLAVVWVGRDDNGQIGLTGAQAALPIWGEIMKKINLGRPSKELSRMSGLTRRHICIDSGGLARRGCPRKWEGTFLSSDQTRSLSRCPLHRWPGLKRLFRR